MNIINQRFGKLIVLKEDENRKGYVICKCDCGNIKSIRKTSLTKHNNPTRSCGCIQKQICHFVGMKTILKNNESHLKKNIEYNTNLQMISKQGLCKNNKSGFTGVCWNNGHQKWQATIYIHNKRIHLGYFAHKEEAIKARKVGEDLYFKPILNSIKN